MRKLECPIETFFQQKERIWILADQYEKKNNHVLGPRLHREPHGAGGRRRERQGGERQRYNEPIGSLFFPQRC
jgi:hypothetical protein